MGSRASRATLAPREPDCLQRAELGLAQGDQRHLGRGEDATDQHEEQHQTERQSRVLVHRNLLAVRSDRLRLGLRGRSMRHILRSGLDASCVTSAVGTRADRRPWTGLRRGASGRRRRPCARREPRPRLPELPLRRLHLRLGSTHLGLGLTPRPDCGLGRLGVGHGPGQLLLRQLVVVLGLGSPPPRGSGAASGLPPRPEHRHDRARARHPDRAGEVDLAEPAVAQRPGELPRGQRLGGALVGQCRDRRRPDLLTTARAEARPLPPWPPPRRVRRMPRRSRPARPSPR